MAPDKLTRMRWSAGIYAVGVLFSVLILLNTSNAFLLVLGALSLAFCSIATGACILVGMGEVSPGERSRLDKLPGEW